MVQRMSKVSSTFSIKIKSNFPEVISILGVMAALNL